MATQKEKPFNWKKISGPLLSEFCTPPAGHFMHTGAAGALMTSALCRRRLWTLLMGIVCLAGCGGGGSGGSGATTGGGSSTSPPILISIAAAPESPSLKVGTQIKLVITGQMSDGSATQAVGAPYFASSAPTVAPVDQSGNVSALAVGSTTITVSLGSITTTATVTVTPGLATVSYVGAITSPPVDNIPSVALIRTSNGDAYGSTTSGIKNLTPVGTQTVPYALGFSSWTWVSLIQTGDGNFYGTTADGGMYGYGKFFQLNPQGVETVLYSFGASQSDGIGPVGLVLGTDGNFYGVTSTGGTNSCIETPGGTNNCGTVFKITPTGIETILYSFGANATDGEEPNGLILANDGNLYGTTSLGGTNACGVVPGEINNCGTLFRLTLDGTETVLFSFGGDALNGSSPHGIAPQGVLLQGSDGNLYGVTSGGGNGCGIIYRMTLIGTQSVLHAFGTQNSDGCGPNGLIQASDGNFYGTTNSGGAFGGDLAGTVFEITPAGIETVLYSFGPLSIAPSEPNSLIQGGDGSFYGFAGSQLFKLVVAH